jgi:anthranilate/para-aminobenzoate synthase component II
MEGTMSEKVAAAILACEASRQQQAIISAGPGKPQSRDVAADLLKNYRYMLDQIKDEGK